MKFLKNLFASEVNKNTAALQDPRARVRHAAATFFLCRARTGRPVLDALPSLKRALTQEYTSTLKSARTIEELREMSADVGFRQVVSQAIMATIGAHSIAIAAMEEETPDLEGFRLSCRRLATDEDPIIRQDAKLYLKYLFGE